MRSSWTRIVYGARRLRRRPDFSMIPRRGSFIMQALFYFLPVVAFFLATGKRFNVLCRSMVAMSPVA